jgi:uncharacterized protein (UPF0248 family)
MRTSHALLLRLFHDPHFDFKRVSVEYLNRGAPSNRSVIIGEDILQLEQGWMEVASQTGTVCIPYHRIRRILYEGETMWELGAG